LGSETEGKPVPSMTMYTAGRAVVVVALLVAIWAIWRAL
jgi:hypothetical protein